MSRISSLAASTQRCSAPSRSPPGESSSRPAIRAMATELATSPAAAPPIPSATASSRGPAYPLSSLPSRSSPTSDAAAYRSVGPSAHPPSRSVARSSAQLQNRLADTDRYAERDRCRAGHLRPVEVRAVGRAEILDEPLPVARNQPGVPIGGVVVGEDDGRVVGPTDRDGVLAQRDGRAREGTLQDNEALRGVTPPGLLWLGLLRLLARRSLGRPGRPRSVDVGADDADSREHEQPEQDDDPDPHDGEDELRHQPSPAARKTRDVSPMTISSPSESSVRWSIVRPLTTVPFVDPRSRTPTTSPSRRSSACRRETPGS